MAGSLNKVMLLGNLGQDPDVRSFANGGRVCNFSLATSTSWKDKTTGERRERTEWHRVAIFAEGLVAVAEKYLKKGAKVYVEGQLETRKWTDQSGADRYTTEIVLRPFTGTLILLGDARGQRSAADDYPDAAADAAGGGHAGAAAYRNAQRAATAEFLDDDIPF